MLHYFDFCAVRASHDHPDLVADPTVYIGAALNSWILRILGWLFLPWTTLMYLIIYAGGLIGFNWIWLNLSFLSDIDIYACGAYGNQEQIPGYSTYFTWLHQNCTRSDQNVKGLSKHEEGLASQLLSIESEWLARIVIPRWIGVIGMHRCDH